MFVPKDEAAFEKGESTCGFGIICYGEGSVYYGDIYFDGKNYNKWGFGRQDFLLSTISGWNPFESPGLWGYDSAGQGNYYEIKQEKQQGVQT